MLTKENIKQLFRANEHIKPFLNPETDEQRIDAKVMRKLIDYLVEEVDKSKKDNISREVHKYLETDLQNNYSQ